MRMRIRLGIRTRVKMKMGLRSGQLDLKESFEFSWLLTRRML